MHCPERPWTTALAEFADAAGVCLSRHVLSACSISCACVRLPEPPAPTEDLSSLFASYDRPTAEISERDARAIVDGVKKPLELAELLDGLRFVRTAITDTDLFVVPFELAGSIRYSKKFSQSLELAYVLTNATGSEESDATIHGAATLSNLTLSTLVELRPPAWSRSLCTPAHSSIRARFM